MAFGCKFWLPKRLQEATWDLQERPQGGVSNSDAPATERADPVGKGREGVNPFPGTGDWGFPTEAPHALRPEASAD